MTATIENVRVNGVDLPYITQGQGEPVLFIHGYISDHRAWEGQRETIAQNFRFIAPTQRYFGAGDWPDAGESFSFTTHVDDLAVFIRALDIAPAHVVGWSYGAAIGIALAAWRPELVKSLFAYEPGISTFIEDPELIEFLRSDRAKMVGPAVAANEAGDFAHALRLVFNHANDRPGLFDTLSEAEQAAFLDNARTIPLLFGASPPTELNRVQLAEISAPIVIARGELTRPFYRVVAEEASRCIQNAVLLPLQNGMHAAPVLTPDAFNAALLEFLEAMKRRDA